MGVCLCILHLDASKWQILKYAHYTNCILKFCLVFLFAGRSDLGGIWRQLATFLLALYVNKLFSISY